MTRFDEILEAAKRHPPRRVAAAAAHDITVLSALKEAEGDGFATDPVLVGRADEILQLADSIGYELAPGSVVDERNDARAAVEAADLVRQGRADVLMKGLVHTDDFLRGVLDKDRGLRAGVVMSHVFVLELPYEDRLLLVSDAAMNIAPDITQKAQIILNACYLANVLGIEAPRVAVLGAVEVVNPKMPATMDASALAKMGDRGQFTCGIIDGPFGLDNAIDVFAAQHKKITGPVAGRADVLIVPDIEAGNILAKAHVFIARGRIAGVVVGAAAPVVLTSRADSAEAKKFSIALAILLANIKRSRALKLGRVHY